MTKPSLLIVPNPSPRFMTIRISLQNADATSQQRLNLIGQQALRFIQQHLRQAMAKCQEQHPVAQEILASLELHITQTMAIIHCSHLLCSQFNQNSDLPCHAFFGIKPQEEEALNNLLNSKESIPIMPGSGGDLSYGEVQCWTKTDNNGNNYVTCGNGRRSLNRNPGGKDGPKITFDPPSGDRSIDQPINPALTDAVEKVAKDLNKSLRVSSATGGHTSGNHTTGNAVDINRIDDFPVTVNSGKDLDNVMQSFRDIPDVYQVFGPRGSQVKVDGAWVDDENHLEPGGKNSVYNKTHYNHIHVGMSGRP